MWSLQHYRSSSFQQDLLDNLKNVAIPGTGIPLSVFCINRWIAFGFVLVLNPVICFLGAINKSRKLPLSIRDKLSKIEVDYINHLLHPQDWFSFWQLNCRLTSYHSLITNSIDFQMEDKWTFLVEGKKLNIPISPYYEMESIVCKNKNIEGGMGIHFYKNAVFGGDWIIQQKLTNDKWLNQLLPINSPLSTMRVITSSRWCLSTNKHHQKEQYIKALSAVLRLGREGALTDHSSALFDVDIHSGKILYGVSNMHWYQLGFKKAINCSWLPPISNTNHPDSPYPQVTGQYIPNIKEVLEIVTSAHFQMMKDVPMVGWDVSFTPDGIYLLEVNLSCNFFRGTFDIENYIKMVDEYWRFLDKNSNEIIN